MSIAVARRDPRGFFEQHRSRIVILFVLAVVIWFLLAFAEQAWRARQLQAEATEQRAAIAAIESDNAKLQAQLDVYGTDAWLDYAQSRARRDLNLANPGETVLMVRWGPRQPGDTPQPATTAPDQEPSNWQKWVDTFTGGR
jgi:cell division protein FtsB